MLAVLALRVGRPVSRDQLIDHLWGDDVPTYAVNLIQKRVSELRALQDPARAGDTRSGLVRWTGHGYLLQLPPEAIDACRHNADLELARSARGRGDLRAAVVALTRALDLWRGPAFEGLAGPLLDAERERLAEARTTAVEDRIDAQILLGEDVDLVPELRRLVADHPLRDRLRGLLMRVLQRAGRQAEALEVYQQARHYLADELGIDPSPALREMYQRVLSGEPIDPAPDYRPATVNPQERAAGPPNPASTTSEHPTGTTRPEVPLARPTTATRRDGGRGPQIPAELPHPLPGFVGRAAELAQLDALVAAAEASGELAIIVLTGTAGVGKSTLAVHWAHRIRERYTDGQLYVNLRGFDPTTALAPAEAIGGFLTSLAPEVQGYPVSLDRQAALFRSLVARGRLLMLLDNASDAEQVRALLPGAPGCLVLVTSRRQLGGLVVTDGAQIIDLDLPSAAEARSLLARRLGAQRVAAAPEAIDRLVNACARLPLALSIVAGRAATAPRLSLATLADEIEAAAGLDAYSGDDTESDVRTVLSWSFDRLSPAAARVFRLLGRNPAGPDFGTLGVASLAALSPAQARRTLAELTRANLLTERRTGRYACPDLLRAYAEELAAQGDPATGLAALIRVLDHYLSTAVRVDRMLNPHRDEPLALDPVAEGVVEVEITDRDQARAWLDAERPVLVAAVLSAEANGLDRHAARLAIVIGHDLEVAGHWHESTMVLERGLRAAQRLPESTASAWLRFLLARAHLLLDEPDAGAPLLDEALAELDRAAEMTDAAPPIGLRADIHRSRALRLDRLGRYDDALAEAQRALALFRSAGGHPVGEGRALNAVGWFNAQRGDTAAATQACQDALDLQERTGDLLGAAETLDSLGLVHANTADHEKSIDCYGRAADLYRRVEDRYNEADTRLTLGDVLFAAGRSADARAEWAAALTAFEEVHHRNADVARDRLARVTPAG